MKLVTILTLSLFAGPALADEYNRNTYDTYGYGAPAATLQGSGLKSGRQGSHVSDRKEDTYYPGFAAGDPSQIVLLQAGPR